MRGKYDCEKIFVDWCTWFFLKQVNDILKKQRVLLTPYKSFEPKKLVNLYQNFQDEEYLLDQCAELLSKMILVQAFPNANHRTAFFLVGSYLSKHGIRTINSKMTPVGIRNSIKNLKDCWKLISITCIFLIRIILMPSI